MEVFSTQLLNYHLERREEVIKINLGRRSPEKVGGAEELGRVGQFVTRWGSCTSTTRF